MNPLYLQPGRAPARPTAGGNAGAEAPPAKPATTAETSAGEQQPQAAPQGGIFNPTTMMLLMLPLVFVLFWWTGRKDKKARAELESKLKKGDKVLTRAGVIGKVVEIGEKNAKVEIAPGVVVRMVKTAIEGLAEDETAASTKKDDAKDAKKDEAKDAKKDDAKDAKKDDKAKDTTDSVDAKKKK